MCHACGTTGYDLAALIKLRGEYDGNAYSSKLIDLHSLSFNEFDDVCQFFEGFEEMAKIKVTQEYLDSFPRIKAWREFTEETMEAYDVRWDETQKRVVLPVYNRKGAVCGAQGRTTNGDSCKYFNYENFSKGTTLFGLNNLDDTKDEVMLVEGPTDAMMVNQLTGMNVLALMGSTISKTQADILSKYNTVYIATDHDKAGAKATKDIVKKLFDKVTLLKCIYALLPEEYTSPGTDPGSLPKEVLESFINNAVSVV